MKQNLIMIILFLILSSCNKKLDTEAAVAYRIINESQSWYANSLLNSQTSIEAEIEAANHHYFNKPLQVINYYEDQLKVFKKYRSIDSLIKISFEEQINSDSKQIEYFHLNDSIYDTLIKKLNQLGLKISLKYPEDDSEVLIKKLELRQKLIEWMIRELKSIKEPSSLQSHIVYRTDSTIEASYFIPFTRDADDALNDYYNNYFTSRYWTDRFLTKLVVNNNLINSPGAFTIEQDDNFIDIAYELKHMNWKSHDNKDTVYFISKFYRYRYEIN